MLFGGRLFSERLRVFFFLGLGCKQGGEEIFLESKNRGVFFFWGGPKWFLGGRGFLRRRPRKTEEVSGEQGDSIVSSRKDLLEERVCGSLEPSDFAPRD